MNVIVELSDVDLRVVAAGGAVTGGAITVVLDGSSVAAVMLGDERPRDILVLDRDDLDLVWRKMPSRLPLADGARVDVRLQDR